MTIGALGTTKLLLVDISQQTVDAEVGSEIPQLREGLTFYRKL